jgi:hypothetical protein
VLTRRGGLVASGPIATIVAAHYRPARNENRGATNGGTGSRIKLDAADPPEELPVRHFLIAFALAVTASTADAQYIIYNSNLPSPPGNVHVVNTPPFYNGIVYGKGQISAFPVAPRYSYIGYSNRIPGFFPPTPVVISSNPGYNPYPSIWQPAGR